MVKCSIKCCSRNARDDIAISFFRFPAESLRCDEWLRALGRPDLQGVNADKMHQSKFRVCSVHFHSNSFSSMLMNRLKKEAVPILFPSAAGKGPFFHDKSLEGEKLKDLFAPDNGIESSDNVNESDNNVSSTEKSVPVAVVENGDTKIENSNIQSPDDSTRESKDSQEDENLNSENNNRTNEDEGTRDSRTEETSSEINDKNSVEKSNVKNKDNDSKSESTENENDTKEPEKMETEDSSKPSDEKMDMDSQEKSESESRRKTDKVAENGVRENSEASGKQNDSEKEGESVTSSQNFDNEEDDDDFNPLLLCPDISMDVEESPVVTSTETESVSTANDMVDSNALFAPLFSAFVDEMTGAEVSFNLTAEEQQLREKLYGPNNPIEYSKVHCTACNIHLGSALAGQNNRFVHPLLKVLICKECYHFYTSGEFEKDEDGSELYCRWCGQGGQVICCSKCEFVFCKKCIRINFGRKKLTEVRDSDEWKCFRCDLGQLKAQRAMCVEFFEYVRRETARAATLNDPNFMNRDLTNCCQTQLKKRLGEPDNEAPEKEVKRSKRRKNDEDPDYTPFVPPPPETEAPVPSTSGVTTPTIRPLPPLLPKPNLVANEVSFPGKAPSPSVRIGNTVMNVKSSTPTATPQLRSSPSFAARSPNTAVRSPLTVATPRAVVKPRTPNQTPQPRTPTVVAPSPVPVRLTPTGAAPKVANTMKHEWFEKTVRAAARVNSNLSYTLTQLNKAQASASSVEQLAVVHNKLQEILSSSINSLIQIRKNLRTEFIAGIKTIRFPPKPPVDPNDDDVIIVNSTVKPTTEQSNKSMLAMLPQISVRRTKSNTTNKVTTNNTTPTTTTTSTTPNRGYLKVKSFSQLQTVTSECITIPDDDPPQKEEDPLSDPLMDKDPLADDPVIIENNSKNTEETVSLIEEEDTSENDKVTKKKETNTNKKNTSEETNSNGISETNKESNEKNKEQVSTNEKEKDEDSNDKKDDDDSNASAKLSNGTSDIEEVKVKEEPDDGGSYNVKEKPSPNVKRMLSVKVNLKKTPTVEDMVKQEPVENGGE